MVSGWKIFECTLFIIKISQIFAQSEKIHRRTGPVPEMRASLWLAQIFFSGPVKN
jgi:hypothetical protein